MKVRAKICGLKTKEAIEAAEIGGAEFLGFIFYPPSPRYITPAEAGKIAHDTKLKKVAVVVNPSNEALQEIVDNLKPDYIQLHGGETEKRAREIKEKFKLPLIRSADPNNYPDSGLYDFLLVDTPGGGGSGIAFDWKNFTPPKSDYFLSGGLNAGNVAEALKVTHAKMVDISSGVESTLGVKDITKIKEFLGKLN